MIIRKCVCVCAWIEGKGRYFVSEGERERERERARVLVCALERELASALKFQRVEDKVCVGERERDV